MNPPDFELQRGICAQFGAAPLESPLHLKVGIARNVLDGSGPINGMRVRPTADTTGWYIWAGTTWSDDPEFFVPLHVEHLASWCPQVIRYLQLPIGWRFLLTTDYEDVWLDEQLATQEQ
jgi:hypothetical protein